MKNIKLLNKIDSSGTDVLISRGYSLDGDGAADGIIVRSADMHSAVFDKRLLVIARAGAGINNIPIERCAEEGIVVFNTPGANSNGVKELAIAALLLSSRKIIGGINWASTLKDRADVAQLVEKGKSQFVGPEIYGKTLGVIGLGAIGGAVANAAVALGMNVIGFDPYITVKAAWNLSGAVIKAESFEQMYAKCDYITLHVPSTDSTRGMINAKAISKMKDGVRIINLARGDLVNDDDIIGALSSGKAAAYVTDFPSQKLLEANNVIAIPHLGASTPESEQNCAFAAATQLADYLDKGIIINSVNYPSVTQPPTAKSRTVVLHANIPNMLAQISQAFSDSGINIETLISQAKGGNAVTVIDTIQSPDKDTLNAVGMITGVRKTVII